MITFSKTKQKTDNIFKFQIGAAIYEHRTRLDEILILKNSKEKLGNPETF